MCLIFVCKLKIRFEFYLGGRAEPKYLMVSDPSAMKKDRLHIYRISAKELFKNKNIKNTNQETSKANSIKIIKPITNEDTPIKQTKEILIYTKYRYEAKFGPSEELQDMEVDVETTIK